jgi:hypothetical protein
VHFVLLDGLGKAVINDLPLFELRELQGL